MQQRKEVQHSHIPWISVTLVLLAIASVGYFTQPGLSGALVYRDYGYGGGFGGGSGGSFFGTGQLSIIEFYEQYHIYIDAMLFLIIFLSIGKAVFLRHFGSGGKALYVAVGLALTLALLLWEERTGTSILYEAGLISVFVILLAMIIGTYVGVHKVTGSHPWAILSLFGLGIILYATFPDLFDFLSPRFDTVLEKISRALETDWGRFGLFLAGGVIVILIILGRKTYKRFRRRNTGP